MEAVASSSRSSPRDASACSAASRRAATSPQLGLDRRGGLRAPRPTAASASASAATAARASSRASVQRASSLWRSSRSCSSAASAWRLSGRSRVRASRSTSSARSRLSCVRSSLSCARRRRLRCLPSPAASSISSRRSRGLDVTIAVTRPCETTECISLPRPVSRHHLEHVGQPALGAVDAVLALARAVEPARRSRSPTAAGRPPSSELSSTTSTSASDARLHAVRAGEDDVLHRLPADGERRLLAQRPQHGVGDVGLAGPVRARRSPRRPGEKSSLVRSGNDLKPLRVMDLRCTSRRHLGSSAADAAACSASFLDRPDPRATSSPATTAAISKVRSCGGPSSAVTSYITVSPRRASRSCSADLKSAGPLERLLELRRERLDDRRGGRLEAVLEVARADHRLDHRGEHALGRDERLQRRRTTSGGAAVAQPLGQPEPLRDARGRSDPRPSARGSSSAARRRSARRPAAGTGAS